MNNESFNEAVLKWDGDGSYLLVEAFLKKFCPNIDIKDDSKWKLVGELKESLSPKFNCQDKKALNLLANLFGECIEMCQFKAQFEFEDIFDEEVYHHNVSIIATDLFEEYLEWEIIIHEHCESYDSDRRIVITSIRDCGKNLISKLPLEEKFAMYKKKLEVAILEDSL